MANPSFSVLPPRGPPSDLQRATAHKATGRARQRYAGKGTQDAIAASYSVHGLVHPTHAKQMALSANDLRGQRGRAKSSPQLLHTDTPGGRERPSRQKEKKKTPSQRARHPKTDPRRMQDGRTRNRTFRTRRLRAIFFFLFRIKGTAKQKEYFTYMRVALEVSKTRLLYRNQITGCTTTSTAKRGSRCGPTHLRNREGCRTRRVRARKEKKKEYWAPTFSSPALFKIFGKM